MKAYVEPEEITLMEQVASNLRDKLLIYLLFRLGCRISEALSLKVDDIDFTQGTVTIVHLKRRVKISCADCGAQLGMSHSYCPKCGSKVEKAQTEQQEHRRQRVLPIDSQTLEMLKEYIERGGPVVRDGKRVIFDINRHRAWQIVKECAEKARLPKLVNPETGRVHNVSPHKLRDAFAVMAVKKTIRGTDCECFKSIWAIRASIRQPSIERFLAKSTMTGTRNYGKRRVHKHLLSPEGKNNWLSY